MKNRFTLVWSFRNRLEVLTSSMASADATCPKDIDFCLIDAASNEQTIKGLRNFCNSIEGRVIRICESTYRSSLSQAWNLGMMLTDNRYIIFASSDVRFIKAGWLETFAEKILSNGSQYILMPNHALFCFDKKAIPKMGWFDEQYVAGPHFDPDFMIRASENGVKLEVVPENGFYTHGDEDIIEHSRRTQDVADRLPMHDLTNEIIFKKKWQSDWPGWAEAINRGEKHLPHPPTNISQAKRLKPEIDPHPLYTQKYAQM